jgi:hypothetical protein
MSAHPPTPGSPRAVEAGCTCPVEDNANGEGIETRDGRVFVFRVDCPIHGEGGWLDETATWVSEGSK